MNSEAAHFLTLMNNKKFSSLGDMQLPVSWPDSASIMALASHLRPSQTQFIKNNLSNTRNNMKSQIKNKKKQKYKFAELLMPT